MANIEFKDCGYEFKLEGGVEDSGSISGYCATWDLDRTNEKILPGAFQDCLPDFIAGGFLAHEHNWKSELGTISEAVEDERGLHITARFFSTPDAQIIRQKLQEKMARGGKPKMSIGYRVIDHVREKGVRVLKRIDLVECSLVACPANSATEVQQIKSLEISDEDRERAVRARALIINSRLAHHSARG